MIDKTGEQWDVHRLHYEAIGLEMVLDWRQETLTFRISERGGGPGSNDAAAAGKTQSLTIRFKRFSDFKDDLDAFNGHGADDGLKALDEALEALTESRNSSPAGLWRDTLGHFGFSLLRYGRKGRSELVTSAQNILGWIGATDVKTAWHTSFDRTLSFEHRYKLMHEARQALAADAGKATDDLSPANMLEVRERELLWWATLRIFELAAEWQRQEGHLNINARRALRESSTAYLQMLKNEPRRRDLERFLTECGTDVEVEVKNILFAEDEDKNRRRKGPRRAADIPAESPRNTSNKPRRLSGTQPAATVGDGLIGDEVIRRTFVVWFLKRYDLKSAKQLIFSIPPAGEDVRRARRMLIGLNLGAILLLLFQLTPIPAPAGFGIRPPAFAADITGLVRSYSHWLWGAQAVVQLLSLGITLLFTPTYFRLLMPRALFGSLLAWMTIVITALPDLKDVQAGGAVKTLGRACHQASMGQETVYSLFIGLGIFLFSLIFIGYTITQFISSRGVIVRRTLRTALGLLYGSFFWGMLFALPAKYILESSVEHNTFVFDCFSVIPIVVIGTPVAILFGLIVQLIWEDASLTEPIGEPL